MHWWTDWCCQWGWNCKQIDSKWNSWRRSIHSSDKCNRLLPDICSKCLALFCLVWPARATFCDIIYFLNTMSNIISAAILVHSGNQIISICSNLYVAKGLEAAARSQHRTETSRQQMWHLLSRTQHLIRGLRIGWIESAQPSGSVLLPTLFWPLSGFVQSGSSTVCLHALHTCFHTVPQTLRLGASIYCPDLCRQHLLKCSVQTTGCRLLTN